MENLEQAKEMLFGAVDEVNTIIKYTDILNTLTDSQDIAELREIISDELNHIERFVLAYVRLSGISIAEE